MNSLLSALPTDGNPLAVGRPHNVLDLATDWLVLILQDVLLLCRVPDADLTRCICGSMTDGHEYTLGVYVLNADGRSLLEPALMERVRGPIISTVNTSQLHVYTWMCNYSHPALKKGLII